MPPPSAPAEAEGEHLIYLLVAREEFVAAGRAQVMTNRAAAQSLWVTPKAVDFHMGNIFAKLGISSRRALCSHTLV